MSKNKSNKSRNAYFYFMLELQEKNPKRYPDMNVTSIAAGPLWAKMTAQERKPYQEKAAAYKQKTAGIKYTSTGENVALVTKRREELEAKQQRIKDDIENTIHIAKAGSSLAKLEFLILHVNHYGYFNATKKFTPAEIAVTRFTLVDGVRANDVYHSLVYTGALPPGYAYQARKACDDYHQITVDEMQNNLQDVAVELISFLEHLAKNKNKIPPLYVDLKNREAAENVLKNLCEIAGYDENYLRVYPLEYLLFTLRNAVSPIQQRAIPSVAVAHQYLEKDSFDCCTDVACNFHILTDVPAQCSKSKVIRYAYFFCDNCCGDLGIDLIPGQHVPLNALLRRKRLPSSTSSMSHATGSTVKLGAYPKNPRANYFLSQRTESDDLSVMSDTSSVCGYHNDSEQSQADPNEWRQLRRKNRRNRNYPDHYESSSSSSSDAELHFTSSPNVDQYSRPGGRPELPDDSNMIPCLSQLSMNSEVPQQTTFSNTDGSSQSSSNRRPTKLSDVFTKQWRQPTTGSVFLPVGRGRGRGLAAHISE